MSDRHPKWVRAGHGDIIPAGQPYRHEYKGGTNCSAAEYVAKHDVRADMSSQYDPKWFVDSSWKPPLVLPTEPGSVVLAEGPAQIKRLWFCRSDRTWMNENGTICTASALSVVHSVLFDAGAAR